MVLNVVTGVAASLCAMGFAWLLLKWTEALYGDGSGMFRAYFAGAGGILLAGIVFVLRLPEVEFPPLPKRSSAPESSFQR